MTTFSDSINSTIHTALGRVADHYDITDINELFRVFMGTGGETTTNVIMVTKKKAIKKGRTVTTPPDGPYTQNDLDSMTIPILSTIMKAKGIKLAGNKGEKIQRILDFQDNPASPPKKRGGRKKAPKQPEPSHNHSLHAESSAHSSCEQCEIYGNPLNTASVGVMRVVGECASVNTKQLRSEGSMNTNQSAARSECSVGNADASAPLMPEGSVDSKYSAPLMPEGSVDTKHSAPLMPEGSEYSEYSVLTHENTQEWE